MAERLGTSAERLNRMAQRFSVDRTDRLNPAEPLLFTLLDAIDQGLMVSFTYRSPWTEAPARARTVTPVRVRASDGSLYLLAWEEQVLREFNLAFATMLAPGGPSPAGVDRDVDWSSAFGVWQGEGALEVEVQLAPPGSRYFARQRWTAEQQDSWDDEVLVRRFQAHPSPQLLRRLLSVGPYLLDVRPAEVREMVIAEASCLLERLKQKG